MKKCLFGTALLTVLTLSTHVGGTSQGPADESSFAWGTTVSAVVVEDLVRHKFTPESLYRSRIPVQNHAEEFSRVGTLMLQERGQSEGLQILWDLTCQGHSQAQKTLCTYFTEGYYKCARSPEMVKFLISGGFKDHVELVYGELAPKEQNNAWICDGVMRCFGWLCGGQEGELKKE